MRRRATKERLRNQKLKRVETPTGGCQTIQRAKESLSIETPTHEIDTHGVDRGFRRVGVSCPQGEQPDTVKPRTPADTSRNGTVRPREILEKMSPSRRGEATPRHGTAKGSTLDDRKHQEEGDLGQIYKQQLAPQLKMRDARTENHSLHLDLSPSTGSRGKKHEISVTGETVVAHGRPTTLATRNRAESTLGSLQVQR
ncbi:predicted protein [Arabidopsis lyrata subsp. lyrata]|uniref:Predicted protein n=1 Tax=Arabidopsis lyrata subsp. lyrata TaxID=81972 RepID=D7LQ88_ARALL|nr:predicted protein [Arabidopsis lyrata subsp. lyrata]EFH51431.1 predicted protein [Arabidopsis lyrata subsp. lyrata]